jgi:ribosome biogenesis GTPase
MTGVLFGSSGVGKSTITNTLLDKEHAKVQKVRVTDSRGRHTTAHRELLVLPNGGMIIDTPGLRELQFLGVDEGLQESFDDIEELAVNCRFRDCKHEAEPDCAVKKALEEGTLLPERYESFQKLQREVHNQAAKQTDASQRLEKGRQKKNSNRLNTKFRNHEKP